MLPILSIWTVTACPTPGRYSPSGSTSDPRATPSADPDGDGSNNLSEYLAGTNPVDADSALKVDSLQVGLSSTTISFTAVAGRAL